MIRLRLTRVSSRSRAWSVVTPAPSQHEITLAHTPARGGTAPQQLLRHPDPPADFREALGICGRRRGLLGLRGGGAETRLPGAPRRPRTVMRGLPGAVDRRIARRADASDGRQSRGVMLSEPHFGPGNPVRPALLHKPRLCSLFRGEEIEELNQREAYGSVHASYSAGSMAASRTTSSARRVPRTVTSSSQSGFTMSLIRPAGTSTR